MTSQGYASQRNIQILVSLLKEHGVRHAVLSPGTRNMALVMSLENDPYFTCFSVVDERSAAHFAIGLYLAYGSPVLISCTGATAARNYLPGMTEAYYREVPLVVATAGDDGTTIDQNVMQTIDQMSLPHDSAKYSVRLPVVFDGDSERYCNRVVNEALLTLTHHGGGPVHINIALRGSWSGAVQNLPKERVIRRHVGVNQLPEINARKIMVVVGQHSPFTADEQDALTVFSERFGAVVYTNRLSNYEGPNSMSAGIALEGMDQKSFDEHSPDLIVTIGGQTGDYPLYNRFRNSRIEHWQVGPNGKIRDTYGNLTNVFECSEVDFFRSYADRCTNEPNLTFVLKWRNTVDRATIPSQDLPLSHAFVADTLAPLIPKDSVMHFGILSSLRNWNFTQLDPSVAGYSNVAAFGIDGCLSTFLGHARGITQKAFLIIGDLSFFYDMNSIGIRGTTPNARILLVNNSGGGEFRLYTHDASRFGDQANLHIAAGGHFGSARAWVTSMGWDYIGVRSKQDLLDNIPRFVSDSSAPMLMEVFTTMEDDSAAVKMVRDANAVVSRSLAVKKRIPPRTRSLIKRILGRA